MKRTELIQQIYVRLASLETERATIEVDSVRYNEINIELQLLRLKLTDVMNSICPIIKD